MRTVRMQKQLGFILIPVLVAYILAGTAVGFGAGYYVHQQQSESPRK